MLELGVDPVEWIYDLWTQLGHIIKTDCRAMMIIDKKGDIDWINYPTKEQIENELHIEQPASELGKTC